MSLVMAACKEVGQGRARSPLAPLAFDPRTLLATNPCFRPPPHSPLRPSTHPPPTTACQRRSTTSGRPRPRAAGPTPQAAPWSTSSRPVAAARQLPIGPRQLQGQLPVGKLARQRCKGCMRAYPLVVHTAWRTGCIRHGALGCIQHIVWGACGGEALRLTCRPTPHLACPSNTKASSW